MFILVVLRFLEVSLMRSSYLRDTLVFYYQWKIRQAIVTLICSCCYRLRRRIESYRRRQSDCMPRYDQSFNGHVEQNMQDTLHLKQRFLDGKAKRTPKTSKDKKQQESLQGSVHVVSQKVIFRIIPHQWLAEFLFVCEKFVCRFYRRNNN